MTARAIRLVVSSTFSDMKAERDLLQRESLPKLKQLCLSKGLRFQAIDLRRGVSEEAGRPTSTRAGSRSATWAASGSSTRTGRTRGA